MKIETLKINISPIVKLILIFSIIFLVQKECIGQEKMEKYDFLGMGFGRKEMIMSSDSIYEIRSSLIVNNRFIKKDRHGKYVLDSKLNTTFLYPETEITNDFRTTVDTSILKGQPSLRLQQIEYKNRKLLIFSDSIGLYDYAVYDKQNDFLKIVQQLNKFNVCYDFSNFQSWKNRNEDKGFFYIEKDVKSKLPRKYQRMILDKPIEAKIIKIEEITERKTESNVPLMKLYQTTFNVGRKDGIVEGIRFYLENRSYVYSTITEVYEEECIGFFVRSPYNYDIEIKLENKYSTAIKDNIKFVKEYEEKVIDHLKKK